MNKHSQIKILIKNITVTFSCDISLLFKKICNIKSEKERQRMEEQRTCLNCSHLPSKNNKIVKVKKIIFILQVEFSLPLSVIIYH